MNGSNGSFETRSNTTVYIREEIRVSMEEKVQLTAMEQFFVGEIIDIAVFAEVQIAEGD